MNDREFWIEFFKGPLQLSLERNGTSLERMMAYAIIHHDHHFFCEWATGSFMEAMDFDNIREEIFEKERFPKEYEWVRLSERTETEVNGLLRMIIFTGNRGAHANAFKLLRWRETG